MALNSLGLGFVFTARDLASGTIGRVSREFGGLDRAALAAQASYQRNIAVMGAGFATMAVGIGTLMGGFALAEQASGFENQIARVGQITRASADDLQLLHDAAIQAGIATQFSPQESAQGLEVLGQAGFNAQQSMSLLRSSLDFAAGGQVGIESAASAMASAVRVFRLEGNAANLVADQFLRITNSTMLGAGDMELAMGTVARGAGLTRQTIEEMLPAIGLVRNTGVDVSVAASSVSSALVFMAQRSEQFKTLGVNITDAAGEFRPFLDIVQETEAALSTQFPDAAERAAAATDLFSRFGITAYNAITTQLGQGITDTTGRLYQGAEAVNYLRSEMANAAGTAAQFRDAMLDTYEGQKTLLAGVMQTLGVVVGEGFTRGLRPIVSGITSITASIIEVFQDIPVEIRGVIAQGIIMFGFLAASLGAVVTVGAGIALIAPFFIAIVKATALLLVAMAPLVAVFGLLYAGVRVFQALRESHDGFSVAINESIRRTRLAFDGLISLFSTGELRGALAEELLKPANDGILTFITRIYMIGFRIVQFFRGIGIGFRAGIDAMGPSVDLMMEAFSRLGRALGFVSEDSTKAIAGLPSSEFAQTGARIGLFISEVVDQAVKLITIGADIATGFVAEWRRGAATMKPIFTAIGILFDDIGERMSTMGLTGGVEGQISGWELFGRVLAFTINSIATGFMIGALLVVGALDLITIGIQATMAVVRSLHLGFTAAGNMMTRHAFGVRDSILGIVDGMISSVARMVAMIPAPFRPQGADAVINAGIEADARILTRRVNTAGRNASLDANLEDVRNSPAIAQQETKARQAGAQQSALGRVADLIQSQQRERDGKSQTVIVQLDSEVLVRATNRAGRNIANGEFRQIATARNE